MNTQNLKPFKKGQSGNPSGRTPVLDIREHLKKRLAETTQDGKNTNLDIVIDNLIITALSGNVRAIELIFNYAYGKPKENGGNDLEICTVIMPKLVGDFED
jgi:hypothetical protein